MRQQLSLPGLDFHRVPLDRLFFAILASSAVAVRVAELSQRLRRANDLTGVPIAQAWLHISLFGLGDYLGLPGMVVEAAKQAGRSVCLLPFQLSFDQAMSFACNDDKRPFVIRVSDSAALTTLHQALGMAMKKAGLGRWVGGQFTPHMTLVYDERLVEERPIETIRWTVRDFSLVHSLLGRTRHIELARWPLRG